jgi:PAS domain S-box-containing protein
VKRLLTNAPKVLCAVSGSHDLLSLKDWILTRDLKDWDEQRLAALVRHQILDTIAEPELDDVVALVSAICKVPIALISLVDVDRQWFKAKVGVEATQTGLDTSVCALAIRQNDVFVIEDLAADPRTAHMSLVAGDPRIRFYAGAPLITSDGYALGSLCAIDTTSRPEGLTPEQQQALKVLARHVIAHIELKRGIHRREKALVASEIQRVTDDNRYRLLVEAVVDYAIYMLDADGIVTSWNPGAQRFKGYEAEEIIGKHFSAFYGEDDRQAGLPERALEKARTEGRFESEGWRVRKDGTQFWAHVVIDPIRTPTGDILGYAKITRDLSERRLAEEALRRSEQQFKLLVQGVTDYSIYMLDPDGKVTNWNPGAQRIKGYAPEEIIGQHFSRFYTDEDRENGAPDKALDIAAIEGRIERDGWRVRKDGTRFWANVIIDAVRDESGRLIGFAKITRDITEQKETQRALEEAREALFQSQKMEAIGQLTGGLAHDFNNLLTGISGSLELMEARLAQGRIKELDRFLGVAQSSAKRAAALTHRLLAFSRRQTLDPKPTDVNRLVADMDELVRRTAGPTIEVETIAAGGLWTTLIDANQLENALLNLCINARDAMPDGGRLTVETANKWLDARTARERDLAPGQYVTLCVSDTGSGMPKDVVERAFEPFYTTKPLGEGTGLGLSMVYGFVRQSAGQARIYSEIGEGTMVCLYLPRYHGKDEIVETEGDLTELPHAENGETVLIVDDEPAVRMLVTEVLGDLDYRAIEAQDGPSGLKILETGRRIDLLITDVGLPGGINGRQLADAALALRPQLKVLFITGYAENAVVGNGHLKPGMHILTKPFALEELGRRIKNILETK